jgi:lysyl-tRNA synthetase class 2
MASIEELRDARIKKINLLKEAGMDSYPVSVFRDYSIKEVKESFDDLIKTSEEKNISIAGRVMIVRGQGAILFIVLQDGDERFQSVLKKDSLEEKVFNLFVDTVDNGDFISVTGSLFVTQRGEQSILIKDWKMATKALLPLPDKWHGLQDIEETYRKRYLDILMDKEVYERFIMRSKIIKFIREFFDNKNFLEIETPILQHQAGGAMAKTFNTHHNDYDMDMVLRISLELEHKMIMTGGYERVYEIGKNFRNEGSDPTHLQEFSMIEWYAAYQTLETNMKWTEELIKSIANDVIKKNIFTVYDNDGTGVEVDISLEWPRITFGELLKKDAGIDIETITLEEARVEALKWGVKEEEVKKLGRGNLLDKIYKKSSRKKIINPTFVTDFPGDLKPLAQQNENGTAKVCQLIIAGAEITNQYAELVNPLIQRELLVAQSKSKDNGDEEAMQIDEEFLTAMEHGMPPMTGFGMGIDRLVAIFTEQKNLRDTIFFPIMKPRDENN